MKKFKHRYYGKVFTFTLNQFSVGDIIHIYLASCSYDDFTLKLDLTHIEYEVEHEG